MVSHAGAIMDLGGWLRSLELEKYEATFRENEINERVLPTLTAEDLKELGVTALGHRRILLNAIATLSNDPKCRQRHSLQRPRYNRSGRRLPRPSRKPSASVDM